MIPENKGQGHRIAEVDAGSAHALQLKARPGRRFRRHRRQFLRADTHSRRDAVGQQNQATGWPVHHVCLVHIPKERHLHHMHSHACIHTAPYVISVGQTGTRKVHLVLLQCWTTAVRVLNRVHSREICKHTTALPSTIPVKTSQKGFPDTAAPSRPGVPTPHV